MRKLKGYSLVFTQFLLIFIMSLPLGTPTNNFYVGLFIIVLGLSIGILALYSNRSFNITPNIKENAPLVTSGVYSLIRHPMYTSVLSIMLGVVLLYPIKYIAVSYALLVLTLLLKLLYEESLWKKKSNEYVEYMQGTKRLVPFIF